MEGRRRSATGIGEGGNNSNNELAFGPSAVSLPFSAGLADRSLGLSYEYLVEEQFAPRQAILGEEDNDPVAPSTGSRRIRKIILSRSPSSERIEDGEKLSTLEVSSDSGDGGNRRNRSRINNRTGRPKKIKRVKGSPRLVVGPCPTLEDYLKLSTWTNEEIRSHTLEWLDRIRKKSGNINGVLSGMMRSRVTFTKSVINTLEKADD